MKDFIQTLPKAELHLHLEGAIPWDMVQTYSDNPPACPPPWWNDDFRFEDFGKFSEAISACFYPVLTSTGRYSEVAQGLFASLAAQNVRYLEVSFSPFHAKRIGADIAEIIQRIKSEAPKKLIVRVFAGFSRRIAYKPDEKYVQNVLNLADLDGIDLHGNENDNDSAPFAKLYAAARERGLMTRAHAGELRGPESITEALDYLKVKRIEHGTTAMRDEKLMQRLADEQITLDLCPMSNVKLRVVDDIKSHPMRLFYERGIPITVNTDDPTAFGCTLTSEIQLLADEQNFTKRELADLQINAFRAALITEEQRQKFIDEIESLLSGD